MSLLKQEEDFIKKNYKKMTDIEIAKELGCSRSKITQYRAKNNLKKEDKWNEKTINELKILSKTKSISELAEHFNTTNHAISTIASNKNIKLIDEKNKWTKEDTNTLIELSRNHICSEIAEIMGKSSITIKRHADLLNISLLKTKKWTLEQDEELIRYYKQGKNLFEISKLMNFSEKTILTHARLLQINIIASPEENFTQEELERLILLSDKKTLNELSKILDKSYDSIKKICKDYNINIKSNRWTEKDKKTLKRLLLEGKNIIEIASEMNRTPNAINIKISRLGYSNLLIDDKWSKEEEDYLISLWNNYSTKEIANKLGRTISSIKNKAYKLGLNKKFYQEGEIGINELSEILSTDTNTILFYYEKLGLKVQTRYISNATKIRYVKIEDIYIFHEEHPELFDITLIEKHITKRLKYEMDK